MTKHDAPQSLIAALYIVATPIGNLQDISLRAIDVLKQVSRIFVEDTRNASTLLRHYNIAKNKLISCHNFNEASRVEQAVELLTNGQAIALISDAGTPGINDPGQRLVKAVLERDLTVVPIPGPCALITALSASGIDCSGGFNFLGFLPAKKTARDKTLQVVVKAQQPIVFYEAPHRLEECLTSLTEIFTFDRQIVVARELSKMYETITVTTVGEASSLLTTGTLVAKGEIVIIIAASKVQQETVTLDPQDMRWLQALAAELPPSQAAKIAAKVCGVAKKVIFDLLK